MAYAGKVSRGNRTARQTTEPGAATRNGREATAKRARQRLPVQPAGTPDGETDWQQMAVFAGGLAIGLALGASAALLFAPRSGAATRHAIVERGRDVGTRVHDTWDDVRDDVLRAARRGRRRLQRRLKRRLAAARAREDDEY